LYFSFSFSFSLPLLRRRAVVVVVIIVVVGFLSLAGLEAEEVDSFRRFVL